MTNATLYEAISDRLITAKKSEMSDFTKGCFFGEINGLMAGGGITCKQGRELYIMLDLDRNKYKQDIDAWEYSEFEVDDD